MIGLQGRELHSDRLSLRLLEDGDRAALFEMLQDPTVTESAGFRALKTQQDFEGFFSKLTEYHTGVAILREGTLVGYLHVNRYDPGLPEYEGKNCVQFGFVIGKAFQRRGFGAEALKLLTEYMKQRVDFCFADHFLENEASRRTICRCGYRECDRYTMFFEALGREETCQSWVI